MPWRTGGEVKGKLANGVGSPYPSHYLGTRCIQHYYRWCAHHGCAVIDWTDAPADLNGLVRFAERRNLVSARVPSHFNWSLLMFHTGEILISILGPKMGYSGYNISWYSSFPSVNWSTGRTASFVILTNSSFTVDISVPCEMCTWQDVFCWKKKADATWS